MSLECTNGTLFVERKRTMRVFLARFPCVPRGSASGRRPPGGAPRAGRGPQCPTRRGIGAPALSSRRPRLPAGAGGAIAVYAGAARRCSSPRAKTASLKMGIENLDFWIFHYCKRRRSKGCKSLCRSTREIIAKKKKVPTIYDPAMSLAPTFAALRVFAWTFRLLVQCSPTFKVWFLKFGSSRRVSTRPKIRTTTPSTIILDREFCEWKN